MMQQTLHRHGLVDAAREVLRAIDFAFCKLARIQFSAPWRDQRSKSC
jgi:hypothetical protein